MWTCRKPKSQTTAMEKWEDWRLGLALDGVSSDLASHWPWTSVAPPIAGGSTEKRGWDPAEIGLKGCDPARRGLTLSGRCVLTRVASLGLVQGCTKPVGGGLREGP